MVRKTARKARLFQRAHRQRRCVKKKNRMDVSVIVLVTAMP